MLVRQLPMGAGDDADLGVVAPRALLPRSTVASTTACGLLMKTCRPSRVFSSSAPGSRLGPPPPRSQGAGQNRRRRAFPSPRCAATRPGPTAARIVALTSPIEPVAPGRSPENALLDDALAAIRRPAAGHSPTRSTRIFTADMSGAWRVATILARAGSTRSMFNVQWRRARTTARIFLHDLRSRSAGQLRPSSCSRSPRS